MYTKTISSPLGDLVLVSDGEYLTGLFIAGQKYFMDGFSREQHKKDDLEIFHMVEEWLKSYFAGANPNIKNIKLKPQGTIFRQIVWQELLNIPYSDTITYKELGKKVAKTLGKSSMSSQAIGGAVGHNPILIMIPCHRVIGTDGSLTGYAGGIDKKEYLLALEQASVKGENENDKSRIKAE